MGMVETHRLLQRECKTRCGEGGHSCMKCIIHAPFFEVLGKGRGIFRHKERAMAIDPVCGMSVDEQTAPANAEYEGERYYFCSTHCLHKFQAAPAQYDRVSSPCRRQRSIPARCIPRYARTAPARVPSAAWRSSR